MATCNESAGTAESTSALPILAGATAIAVAAHPLLPMWPVDLTLQTVAVPVVAALLGARRAVAAVGLWLLIAAIGLPVLPVGEGQGSGLGAMAGPASGYLVGTVLAALIVGWAAERPWCNGLPLLFAAMVAADTVLHAAGSAWLSVLYDARTAVDRGIAPYILPDLVMLAAAAHLATSFRAVAAFASGRAITHRPPAADP